MEYPIGLTLDEITIILQSVDVVSITGRNARLVSALQNKLDEAAFQIQMNMQMQEQERIQFEQERQRQLELIIAKEAKKISKTTTS
jgi:ribulose 1,5-bisphosphate synthetase/thiazole synthase